METTMAFENEYRVRAVTRYIITHYLDTEEGPRGSDQIGEYPNVDQAERVGKALSAADHGSTFVSIMQHPKPVVAEFQCYDSETAQKMMEVLFPPGSPGGEASPPA